MTNDKTYELYVEIARKAVDNIDVRHPITKMTPLMRTLCDTPVKWDSKKRRLWMKIFIKFGADVNAKTKEGFPIAVNLLHLRKEDIFAEFIEADSKQSIDLNYVDLEGSNMLHIAVGNGLLKAVSVITEKTKGIGIPLHEVYNEKGQTPLLMACETGDTAMCKTLIEVGADLTIREADCRHGSLMAIEVLQNALLQNQKEQEVKKILEHLIRTSCRYMRSVGQISKMARLLRWCATSVLGYDQSTKLCKEFRPAKPKKPLVYHGPMPKVHQPNVTVTGAKAKKSQKIQAVHESKIEEPIFSTDEFDLPSVVSNEAEDENVLRMPHNQTSPIYTLLDEFSYKWSDNFKPTTEFVKEKLRPYEQIYLTNAALEPSLEDNEYQGLESLGGKMGHRFSIMSRSGKGSGSSKAKRQPSSRSTSRMDFLATM